MELRLDSLSEQLVQEVGRKIVHGELLPEQVLPKVETWSEKIGVSRTVVREALRGLSVRGLVKSNPKIGTVVCPREDWQWWDPDMLSWAAVKEQNDKFLLQLTEVRLAIEPVAAQLAAKKATDQDIAYITESFRKLEQSVGDTAAWVKADYDFHHSIVLVSRNELIINLVQLLRNALIQSRLKSRKALDQNKGITHESPTGEVLERHRAIFDAICKRDQQKAYETTQQLILRVAQLIEDKVNE